VNFSLNHFAIRQSIKIYRNQDTNQEWQYGTKFTVTTANDHLQCFTKGNSGAAGGGGGGIYELTGKHPFEHFFHSGNINHFIASPRGISRF
jgi:hypothetical protein